MALELYLVSGKRLTTRPSPPTWPHKTLKSATLSKVYNADVPRCLSEMDSHPNHFFSPSAHASFLNSSCPTDDPNDIYALATRHDMTDTTCFQLGPNSSCCLPEEELAHQNRMQPQDHDEHSPSLYARLKILFQYTDKPPGLPTPPASPQNCRISDLSGALSRDQIQSPTSYSASYPDSLEDTSLVPSHWMPLTPESIDHHHEHGSGSCQSLVRLVEDFRSGEQGEGSYSEEGLVGGGQQLLDDLNGKTRAQDEDFSDQETGLCLEVKNKSSAGIAAQAAEAVPLTRDRLVDRREGVHFLEEDDGRGRTNSKNIRWEKSQAPPIVRVGFEQAPFFSFYAKGRLTVACSGGTS